MRQHMIFFDIDGTLVSEMTHQVPQSAKEAIAKARENGHLAFINTGRSLPEIEPEILNVGFDGVISGCGTHILYKGDELLALNLGNELSKEIVEDLKRCKIDGLLEAKEGLYYSRNIFCDFIVENKKYHETLHPELVKYWDDPEINFDKMALWWSDKALLDEFCNKYNQVFDFIDRGERFVEVVPVCCSKATGIRYMMDRLKVPHECTIGIGDSENDIPMLNFVAHSVVMGNGVKSLWEKADYITKSVEEHGIRQALIHYELI